MHLFSCKAKEAWGVVNFTWLENNNIVLRGIKTYLKFWLYIMGQKHPSASEG